MYHMSASKSKSSVDQAVRPLSQQGRVHTSLADDALVQMVKQRSGGIGGGDDGNAAEWQLKDLT